MKKIRVGIFFGGSSREREISFAGGRTVYDNLDKEIFTPVPIFVDSNNNFILLDWKYIYKGSIRDFYPPVSYQSNTTHSFQIYLESLKPLPSDQYHNLMSEVGTPIQINQISEQIDVAFLCLHGAKAEDGSIQGLLDFIDIPYTGSGVLASAIGISKGFQKTWMAKAGFSSKSFIKIPRAKYDVPANNYFEKVKEKIGLPCVIRPSHQGSSIGVSILKEDNEKLFHKLVDAAFFSRIINLGEWKVLEESEKFNFIQDIADIRSDVGFPLWANGDLLHHPAELFHYLNNTEEEILKLSAIDSEAEVIVEGFIHGREFSCIVVRDENGHAFSLPPTEILKGEEVYDYRSKYLPGLSRKKTPIDLPKDTILKIQEECVRLFELFDFQTYARIDGFYSDDKLIYLNDPNTTSGMLPSSFFFHQAAEIGWNPSQFLSFIVRNSIAERIRTSNQLGIHQGLLKSMDKGLELKTNMHNEKKKVGVILGGYSFERHISVESGRNIYEKLASSAKYDVLPIFLIGTHESFELYQIPINLLLKDNADDIRDLIVNFQKHEITEEIKETNATLIKKYSSAFTVYSPKKLDNSKLSEYFDLAFIGLHGRPGEDGTLQKLLVHQGIPFNGSMPSSASVTIDKYQTLQKLKAHGFKVTDQKLFYRDSYLENPETQIQEILSFQAFPFILKPVDDGCSSAVKLIKNEEQLHSFLATMFREGEEIDLDHAKILGLKFNEEFPRKNCVLAEALIGPNGAKQFLEITGGLLTHADSEEIRFEMFEPSEALAGSEILSLEEKFLAGEGQNITPARFGDTPEDYERISKIVKADLMKSAQILGVDGYCRIDAFVRIFNNGKVETVIIEINSLPGMTPATAIFHQCAINNYKPFNFIDHILEYGIQRNKLLKNQEFEL